jgi:hypothetical protein
MTDWNTVLHDGPADDGLPGDDGHDRAVLWQALYAQVPAADPAELAAMFAYTFDPSTPDPGADLIPSVAVFHDASGPFPAATPVVPEHHEPAVVAEHESPGTADHDRPAPEAYAGPSEPGHGGFGVGHAVADYDTWSGWETHHHDGVLPGADDYGIGHGEHG